MKVFLFLGFLAFARGLRLEGMEAEFEDNPTGPLQGAITSGGGSGSVVVSCQGYLVVKTNENDNEVIHGKLIQEGNAVPIGYGKLKVKPKNGTVSSEFRRATKIIETQGNCCWKVYKR